MAFCSLFVSPKATGHLWSSFSPKATGHLWRSFSSKATGHLWSRFFPKATGDLWSSSSAFPRVYSFEGKYFVPLQFFM